MRARIMACIHLPIHQYHIKDYTGIFPVEIHMYQIMRLVTLTSLFAVSMILFGLLDILEKQKQESNQKKAFKIPLLLLLIWTIPLVSAYIFETNNQSMLQTIRARSR
jgi:hypothetical protein